MPFYDFRFSGQTGQGSAQQCAFRALDLEEAKQAALSWAEDWRRLSSHPTDRSPWLLVISTGEDTEDHVRGTAIFAQHDVRPGEWR